MNYSYSYKNENGTEAFSGTINGKTYNDSKQFFDELQTVTNDASDETPEKSQNQRLIDVRDLTIPEAPEDLKNQDALIEFCRELLERYKNAQDFYKQNPGEKEFETVYENASETLDLVKQSHSDVLKLKDAKRDELATIRKYKQESLDLENVLRNIPDAQAKQKEITEVIVDREKRAQRELTEFGRWEYLYTRVFNYCLFIVNNNFSYDDAEVYLEIRELERFLNL